MNEKISYKALEAVIFAAGEPISVDRLCEVFEVKNDQMNEALSRLADMYAGRGIQLIKMGDSYQFASCEDYAAYIKRAFDIRRRIPLSQAALEVLAVIAYNQPVTRAFVEQVRGVDCSGVVATLIDKDLIEERGRLELPGRPLLYGTTKTFMRCFSIEELSDLPKLPKDQAVELGTIGEQLPIDEDEEGSIEE